MKSTPSRSSEIPNEGPVDNPPAADNVAIEEPEVKVQVDAAEEIAEESAADKVTEEAEAQDNASNAEQKDPENNAVDPNDAILDTVVENAEAENKCSVCDKEVEDGTKCKKCGKLIHKECATTTGRSNRKFYYHAECAPKKK